MPTVTGLVVYLPDWPAVMDVLAAVAAMIAQQRETATRTAARGAVIPRAIDDDDDDRCARPDVQEELNNNQTNIMDAPTRTNVATEQHQTMHDSMLFSTTSSISMQSRVLIDGGDPDNMLVISLGEMSNKPNSPEETDGEDISMSSQTSSMTYACDNRTNLETSKLVEFLGEPAANIMAMIQLMERIDGQWQCGRNNGTETHHNLTNKDGGGDEKLLSDPVVVVAAAAIDASSSLDRHPAREFGASRLDGTSTEEGKKKPSPPHPHPEAIDDGPKSSEEKTDGPLRDRRKIGRMRRYSESDMAYGDWHDIHLPSCGPSDDCDGPSRRIGTRGSLTWSDFLGFGSLGISLEYSILSS